jgi:hypothetical protein
VASVRPLAALLLLLPIGIYASDWHYSGYVKDGSSDTYQFYDAEGIQRPSKDVVRLWVKALTQSSLDRYYKKHEKEIVEKSAFKIVTGYSPQFYRLEATRGKYRDKAALQDVIIQTTSYELIANAPDAHVSSKMYFEIDCRERAAKILDLILYLDNGDISKTSSGTRANPQFIPPDSNGEWLSQLICPPVQPK